MKETKQIPKKSFYPVEEEPIILSKHLLDILLKDEDYSNLVALYVFYYYTAKWQKTNQPHATLNYVAEGMSWGVDKVKRIKKKLKDLGLIDDIVYQAEGGQFEGHYIKVNFIWTKEKADKVTSGVKTIPVDSGVILPPVVETPTNALSTNKGNALSTDKSVPPLKKPSKKERNFEYLPIAKELSRIVQETKHIEHTKQQIHQWTNHIRQLVESNKVSVERINKAMSYLKEHAGEQYCPVIESGSALKEKFGSLEGQMNTPKYTATNYQCPFGWKFGKDFEDGKGGCIECEDKYSKIHSACVACYRNSKSK